MKQSYNGEDAVVLASGGQDSTTCLIWALQNFRLVQAIGFFYNQKHANELDVAKRICDRLGVAFKVVDISFMQDLVLSNMFKDTADVAARHSLNAAVPSSFVPYRNLLFLTLASAWASTLNARHVVTGVCETDFSGYADCRDVFVKSAQATLNQATDFKDQNVVIHTPLMWLTKAEDSAWPKNLAALS